MYVFFAYEYICSEKPGFVSTFLGFSGSSPLRAAACAR